MSINIGDKVRFLTQVGGGKVTGFDKGYVLVEDADGFEIPVRECDLVVVPGARSTALSYSSTSSSTHSDTKESDTQTAATVAANAKLEERISALETLVQKLTRRIDELESAAQLRAHARAPQSGENSNKAATPGKNQIVEVDLHAEALLTSTQGLSPADIKDYQMKIFRETMEQYKKDRDRRIVFIHGNGDGVLRKAILTELKYSYKTCRHQDASFLEYGFGATMVTIA